MVGLSCSYQGHHKCPSVSDEAAQSLKKKNCPGLMSLAVLPLPGQFEVGGRSRAVRICLHENAVALLQVLLSEGDGFVQTSGNMRRLVTTGPRDYHADDVSGRYWVPRDKMRTS